MGGGPSLKLIDPSYLRNEATFAVNSIFLITDWLGFLPTYYMVEDRLVVEDRCKDIENFHGPVKFYDQRYNTKIAPDANTFNINMVDDYSDYAGFPEFSRRADKGVWCGGTVTYLCIQMAFYMGFDPVYLVGIDHNYVRPSHVESAGTVWTSQGDDPNHFHPDYFGRGKKWHDPRVDRMERAYESARTVFRRADRRILNATIGGKLEVFPRVPFNELF